MSRRGSDVGAPLDQSDTASNNEPDSPNREVVSPDDPSPVVQNGVVTKDTGPPPPPPLHLAANQIKTNGLNGDTPSTKAESLHKCSGCNYSTRISSELMDHMRNCPSNTDTSKSPQKAPVGSKCTMCSQVFSSLEAQIKHMTDFHKLKASFKCSFCRMSFGSKELIEAHIKTHASKPPTAKVEKTEKPEPVKKEEKVLVPTQEAVNDDNEDSIGNEIEDVDCLYCGKSFKDLVKHREHEDTCTGPGDQLQGDISGDILMEEYPDYFPHFKHDHINLVTDPDNPFCRGCNKTMNSVLGICNHLSRRHDCRDWYCRNLSKEIKKADELRKSQGVSRPEPLPTRPRGTYSRRSNTSNSNSPLPNEEQPPKRQASLLAQTHMKVASKGQIVEGYDDKQSDKAIRTLKPSPTVNPKPSPVTPYKRPDGHSIECTNCHKVFDGRSPHVGFTNHQRGNADCRENGTRKFIPSKLATYSKDSTPIPIKIEPKQPRKQESPTVKIELDEDESKSGAQYFYCKLCDDGDPKTRTSLGCHLTVHHGLPPVNCKNGLQDAFRCQTCEQMFSSKHYYNQHRHDCDMKSQYVGFCESGAKLGPTPKRSRARNSAPSAIATVIPTKKSAGSSLDCSLCGKTGFEGPNALRIHTKYICVNRTKPDPVLSQPKIPKLRIKTVTEPLETRASRYRDSIPQNTSDSSGTKIKTESLKCSDCGRGPYTNVHHLMEHQKNYCQALKRNSNQNGKRESLQDDIDQIRSTRSAKRFAIEKVEPVKSVDNGSLESVEVDFGTLEIECMVCGINFDGMEKFVKHRKQHVHDEQEEMKCEICLAKVFTAVRSEEFNQHLDNHLQNKVDQPNGSKTISNPKSKIEDVIQRSLTCAVCAVQSKTYDQKVSHERKCRERFIQVLTCSMCSFQAESYDLKVQHERKCLDSFMTNDGFDSTGKEEGKGGQNGDSMMDTDKSDFFAKLETDEKKIANLQKMFKQLLEILDIPAESDTPERDCRRILHNLGEEPVGDNNNSDLGTFRSNISSLLRLVIRTETLQQAYEEAGTVDEALFNLLQNPQELELQ